MSDPAALAHGVILTAYTGDPTPFAGCAMFARDGESVTLVRERTDALRRGGAAPLVAIDQEGGRVARLRDGVEALPSMMALGATGDETLAERAGAATAFDLRRAGCTLDFAPVLDLALEPANTVIGTRAFGSDPALVARMGAAFARGLRGGGIVATFKHVPGHGSTAVDSHLRLPHVEVPLATLRDRDMVPFAACARDAEAMMVAHVVVDALDDASPASLSPAVLRALLREHWGFAGVAFTDCMQMDAIARGIGTVAGVVAAIAAGADCALVSHDVELARACVAALDAAVRDGTLPLERLREACGRVARLRRAQPLPLDGQPPFPGIGLEIARRAVTRVRGDARVDAAASIAISFEGERFDGAAGEARPRPALPGIETLRAPLDPTGDEVAGLLDRVRTASKLPLVLARRAHLYEAQARAVDAIVTAHPETVVVSALEPFDVPRLECARHLLAIYGDDAVSLQGLADVVCNGAAAHGRLPIRTR